jgi:phosphoribosylglycinamide formyltransferase 2
LIRPALRAVIEKHKPDFIVPEIEAIATETLLELEKEGHTVIPTARAARLTMDREGIRRFAAEELKLPVSRYEFSGTEQELRAAVDRIGVPCVVKPVMSSSGKGQSVVKTEADIAKAWSYAVSGGRAGIARVIVEEFIPFDYEITLLTVCHAAGTTFLDPIGHLQIDGDYRESWMPQPMSASALARSQEIARAVTDGLGGRGIFGVELFVRGDDVYFSEVSPRPHDTGLVTLISQNRSEFALHLRAILGLPIGTIRTAGPAASCAILLEGSTDAAVLCGAEDALALPDTDIRLFGKPDIHGKRRMGVALALGSSIEEARRKAREACAKVKLAG